MTKVIGRACARAGLLGNPSDGYNGKTLSCIVGNFAAEVVLEPADQIEIVPGPDEALHFASLGDLAKQIQSNGYYGGVRLIKGAIKRFFEFHRGQLGSRPLFRIRYSSDIPRQVGLAGSSAIVMATLRALIAWYNAPIPPHLLASLTLSVERELGIPAGLQDRVIQAYEGIVYMDFDGNRIRTERELQFGSYEPLCTPDPLPFYIAWLEQGSEPTEVLHNNLKQRFDAGEPTVIQAMKQFAHLAEQGKQVLVDGDWQCLSRLMDENFDLRRRICSLHPDHIRLVETARQAGVSAKFCGSGGAIVGICPDGPSFQRLERSFEAIGARIVRPHIGQFNSTASAG